MKIRFINYKNNFFLKDLNCFEEWFYFEKYFNGKMLHFGFKHYCIEVDFR